MGTGPLGHISEKSTGPGRKMVQEQHYIVTLTNTYLTRQLSTVDFVDGVLTIFWTKPCVTGVLSPKLGGPKETPLPTMLKEQLQSADAVRLVHAVKAGR